MNISLPLISVLLPVYNTEQYLQECLESITAQTYKNWELIIVNDGSTDNSDTIIKAFIANLKNEVKYLSFQHKGLPYCLNRGIEVAKGKYIARMDADDIMLENRLELQVDFLESNTEIGILGGHALEIDANGDDFAMITPPLNDDEIKQALYHSCPIIHPSVMIRRKLLQENLYKELYPNPEDVELWIRLAKITNFRNLDAILIKKRFHKKQITQNSKIFKIRLEQLFVNYNLQKHHFNITKHFLKTISLYFLPNAIHAAWQENRFKQKKSMLKRKNF